MLELFCRAPHGIKLAEGSHLTPIPIDEAVASLSAILLDDAYYEFILAGRKEVDGLPWVGEDRLIPLKASAWLDLGERQAKGEHVDTKNIRKHANDVGATAAEKSGPDAGADDGLGFEGGDAGARRARCCPQCGGQALVAFNSADHFAALIDDEHRLAAGIGEGFFQRRFALRELHAHIPFVFLGLRAVDARRHRGAPFRHLAPSCVDRPRSIEGRGAQGP